MDEHSRFFHILEIRSGASREEIIQAYRDLAQIWHPDRYEHNPRLRAKAEAKLKELNEAYQRLSNYTQPREAPPPSGNSSPHNEKRATTEHSSKPNNVESTKTISHLNGGCIGVIIVAVVVIIVIAANHGFDQSSNIPSPQHYVVQATPSNLPTGLEKLAQMKAQIETRVAAKDMEFDRLAEWYQHGVASQEESVYRNALKTAQKEDSEIESLIRTYNSEKRELAGKAPVVPEIKTYSPQQGGILFDLYPGDAGPGTITIDNGTEHHAICKFIDISTNTKICSYLILANTKESLSGLPDGIFRIIFAYGDMIVEGTDRFQSPSGFSKFDDPIEFTTTQDSGGYQYSTYTITLQPVVGGNARTGLISEDDYNKY